MLIAVFFSILYWKFLKQVNRSVTPVAAPLTWGVSMSLLRVSATDICGITMIFI